MARVETGLGTTVTLPVAVTRHRPALAALAALALLLASTFRANPASACDCPRPPPLDDAFAEADVVAQVKVLALEATGPNGLANLGAKVRVERSWKGARPGAELHVAPAEGRGDCSYWFPDLRPHLLYLKRTPAGVEAARGDCGRSRPLGSTTATAEVAALDAKVGGASASSSAPGATPPGSAAPGSAAASNASGSAAASNAPSSASASAPVAGPASASPPASTDGAGAPAPPTARNSGGCAACAVGSEGHGGSAPGAIAASFLAALAFGFRLRVRRRPGDAPCGPGCTPCGPGCAPHDPGRAPHGPGGRC